MPTTKSFFLHKKCTVWCVAVSECIVFLSLLKIMLRKNGKPQNSNVQYEYGQGKECESQKQREAKQRRKTTEVNRNKMKREPKCNRLFKLCTVVCCVPNSNLSHINATRQKKCWSIEICNPNRQRENASIIIHNHWWLHAYGSTGLDVTSFFSQLNLIWFCFGHNEQIRFEASIMESIQQNRKKVTSHRSQLHIQQTQTQEDNGSNWCF